MRERLSDPFGPSIGEGVVVDSLTDSAAPFRAAVSLIEARLPAGTA